MIDMVDWLVSRTPLLYLTQSLWRDEAFSVLIAQHSPWQIIKLTTSDFNPPLYYLTLHYWMTLFGSSEISIRLLSFIFHLILVYVVYKFSKKIFSSIFSEVEPRRGSTSLLITFLIAFNPMLLYYAFEARMYSLLTLLATLSISHFYQKNWKWYVVFTVLGLYAQPFMIFVILSQIVYLLLFDNLAQVYNFVKKGIILFFLYLPWILVIFNQLKQSGQMWIYPVDFNLITSVLGNLYLGYEGTPGWMWDGAKMLSFILIVFIIYPFIKRKVKKEMELFILWLFLPLVLVIGFSFLKPIYVNRYLIFTTVPLIFLLVFAVRSIKGNLARNLITFYFLLFTFYFSFWYAPFHKKTDFRLTLLEINQQVRENDLILSETPLSFFEANYYEVKYAKEDDKRKTQKIFLYNPKNETVPAYLGSIIIPKERWINYIPAGRQVFLIHDDGNYTKIKS